MKNKIQAVCSPPSRLPAVTPTLGADLPWPPNSLPACYLGSLFFLPSTEDSGHNGPLVLYVITEASLPVLPVAPFCLALLPVPATEMPQAHKPLHLCK